MVDEDLDTPPDREADEFDVDGPRSDRRGVHRARPGAVSRWGPTVLTFATIAAVVVAVVAALVVVGPSGIVSLASQGWTVVTGGSDDAASPATTPSPDPSATPSETPAPTDPVPTATETPAPSAPPSEPAAPEPTVDRDVAVVVLNGTTTTGLASGAASALQDAGWTVERTDNYREDDPPTTVYYSDPALAATAAALAADVGGVATASDAFDDPLTVVLGDDYDG